MRPERRRFLTLLRPAARVDDPSGQSWEIYASRTELPAWRPADGPEDELVAGSHDGLAIVSLVLAVLSFLLNEVLLPVLRLLVALPVAAARGRRSGRWTIRAVTHYPVAEEYAWTATEDQVDRVLEQVVAALARGEIATPLGARFLGRTS